MYLKSGAGMGGIMKQKKIDRYTVSRRSLGILMAFIWIIVILPVNKVYANDSNPDGTQANPYPVSNYSELSTYLKKGYVKMTDDIIMRSSIYINLEEGNSSKNSGIDLNGHILDFSQCQSSFGIKLRGKNVAGTSFTITDSNPDSSHGKDYVTNTGKKINGGIITGYNYDSMGGGMTSCIQSEYVPFTIEKVTFFKNSSKGGGTCIGSNGDVDLTVSDVNFYNNKTDYWSSCIWYCDWYVENNSRLLVKNCNFKDNSGQYSGVVYTSAKSSIIDGCTITNNSTKKYGMICVSGENDLLLKNTVIRDNTASDAGEVAGVDYEGKGQFTLDGKTIITDNTYLGRQKNIHSSKVIKLGDNFSHESKIALGAYVYSGYDKQLVSNIGDFAGCFICDNADGELYSDGSGLRIRKKEQEHVHVLGTYHARVNPTCTTPGTIEYYSCTGCNNKLDADGNVITDITIAALGHDYSGNAPECRNGCGTVNPDYIAPPEPSPVVPTPIEPSDPQPSDPTPNTPLVPEKEAPAPDNSSEKEESGTTAVATVSDQSKNSKENAVSTVNKDTSPQTGDTGDWYTWTALLIIMIVTGIGVSVKNNVKKFDNI